MFSPFAEATRKSAAAASAFTSRATGRATGEPNAFGDDDAGGNRRGKRRPLKSDNGSLHNAAAAVAGAAKQRWGRGRADQRSHDRDEKRSRRRNGPRKPFPGDGASDDPLQSADSSEELPSRPPSRATPAPTPPASDDPLARRIYERLHADGINPPQWPSEPGSAQSKHEMSRFRDLYEAYRHKVRASLTRAGLIDDPDKRKRLSDAIEFKGICEDMCPEFEKITRITEHDVNKPERDRVTGVARIRIMVKKLARSAAGQEAPLPMDVRSTASLRRTLDYLVDDVLSRDKNLSSVHPFLWDRTRAIRRDFAFFSSMTEEEVRTQVYVLENITRFHVTSLHLLSRRDKEDDKFVEQQELEQLGKTLLSLRDVYDDCNEQGIVCENEPEFRAYYLLFHGRDPGILETLQRQWRPSLWQNSDEVRTAVSLVEALQNTQEFIGSHKDGHSGPLLATSGAHTAFFRIVEDAEVSYTMACFAECHFPHLRRSLLATVKRALARPKDPVQDVTAASLNEFLRFDTVEQAIGFAELHNLSFAPDEQDPADAARQFLVLNDRSPLPHVRLSHQFSQSLVERKRGSASLPAVIHTTVFEGTDGTRLMGNGAHDEDSLFVPRGVGELEPELEPEPEPEARPSSLGREPAGQGESTGVPAVDGTPSSSSPKPLKKPKIRCGFIIESDAESGEDEPQPQQPDNPFAPKPKGAAPSQAPALLPTFEEVKSMESGRIYSNGARFGRKSAPEDASQLKPNPFASPFQLPGQLLGSKPAGSDAAKPNPFAPVPGPSSGGDPAAASSAAAKSNPFAGPAQFGGGSATLGSGDSGNPSQGRLNPFSSTAQPASGEEQRPDPGLTKPFAPPPTFGPSTASPPVTIPGASQQTPSSSKPSETLTPAAFGRTTESGPSGLSASLQNVSPSAAVADDQNQAPSGTVSAVKLDTPLVGTWPPGVSGQGAQAAAGGSQQMALAGLSAQRPAAAVFSEQSPTPAGAGAVPPPKMPMVEAPSFSTSKASDVPGAEAASAVAGGPVRAARDLLGDVNNWYVKGDQGLLSEFLVESVRSITQDVFDSFTREEEERKRREEEERTDAEVERFRVYNLSLKFFYLWKRNARAKRLRAVARKGRDEMRAYIAQQRAAQRKAQEAAMEASERASERRRRTSEELSDLVRSTRAAKLEAREMLLATGVLSGVGDERRAAKRIVGDDSASSDRSQSVGFPSPRPAQRKGPAQRQGPSPSPSAAKKEGPKMRALRELYLTPQPEGFRRSLPSMTSLPDGGDGAQRASNASPRWRLKAMGIVQLPDGTAVPEMLARDFSGRPPLHPRPASSYRARRIAAMEAMEAQLKRSSTASPPGGRPSMDGADEAAATMKRKRSSGEGGGEAADGGGGGRRCSKRLAGSADQARMQASVEISPANKRKRPGGGGDDDDDDNDDGGGDDGESAEGGGGAAARESSHRRIMSQAEQVMTDLRALRRELEEGAAWYRAQNERLMSEASSGRPWRDDGSV